MPTYETIFITSPNLTDEDEKRTVEGLAQIITDGGGAFTANERLGRRRLAYPIHKFDDGVYTRFLYDSGVEPPKELERRTRLSDSVLRSLTVRLEPEWAAEAKQQAIRDAQRRVEAAAEAAAEAERQVAEDARKAEEERAKAETAAASSDGATETAEENASAVAESTEPEKPAESVVVEPAVEVAQKETEPDAG